MSETLKPKNIYDVVVYSIADAIILYSSVCTPTTQNLIENYYSMDPDSIITLNIQCLQKTDTDFDERNTIQLNMVNYFGSNIIPQTPQPIGVIDFVQKLNLKSIKECLAQKISKDNNTTDALSKNINISGLSKSVIYQFIDGCLQIQPDNKQYTQDFIILNTPKRHINWKIVGIVGIVIVILLLIRVIYTRFFKKIE